jgi:hypothetical protein
LLDELAYAPPLSKTDTPPVDAVRAFVFLSGMRWLQDHGVAERYRELLPPDLADQLTTTTATEWVSLADALVIYAALDALGLTPAEQVDLGRAVSTANNGVVITTISRLAGSVGVSPWFVMQHANRAWQRSNRGGAIAVYKTGEKAARLEFWQVPLARSPFFVTSMRGAIAVGIEPFCERVVVTEVAGQTNDDGFALRVAW